MPVAASLLRLDHRSMGWAERSPPLLGIRFESQVHEHGILKGLPGEVGVGDAVHGALGDAGMGGAEAVQGGLPAEESFLLQATAVAVAEEAVGAGDPGALEGVDDHASRVVKDSVIKGEGLPIDLIGAGREVIDESHADGSHADFRQVFVCFQNVPCIRKIPLEKCHKGGRPVVEFDAGGSAGGTMQLG